METAPPVASGPPAAKYLRWASILFGAASLVLFVRSLPLETGLKALQGWVGGLGFWGPLIYAAVYAIAVTLLVPGSALTLAAGALFGLLWGTISVSIGATTGVALSFLVARYLARDRVAAWAARNPKFEAIDKAIGKRGWKIVALLRLSPAVPFNLQNYLYGLTAIRFWPCVLASWLFTLPGTFLYVYLGHIGAQGVAAASGGPAAGRSPLQWAFLAVGLVATAAVTVYVARFANAAVKEQTEIGKAEPSAGRTQPAAPAKQSSPLAAGATALAALLIFCSALYAYAHRDQLRALFGPPPVTLTEAYQPNPNGPRFDHSEFTAILGQYVDPGGWVDYEGLRSDQAALNDYLASLASAPFDAMGRDEKLAFLINAYNVATLRLILDHYPLQSILDIPADQRWDGRAWSIGGHSWTLNEIEHEQIRPKFREPRIHFALVCASVGCPKLRNEAYDGTQLEQQLEDQTNYVLHHDRWFQYDAGANSARLTRLLDWYGGDFSQVFGSPLQFIARYSPELKRALDDGRPPSIVWMEYDWSLNSQANRK